MQRGGARPPLQRFWLRLSRAAPALLALLALAACAGRSRPAASPPPASPGRAQAPSLLVARGSDVLRYEGGRLRRVGSVEGRARLAVAGAQQDEVIVERRFGENEARSELLLLREGATPSRLPTHPAAEVILYDTDELEASVRALYATRDRDTGDLYALDLATGTNRRIAQAFAEALSLERASGAGDVVVVSSTCDLTECVRFVTLAGQEVRRPSPTDGLPYNAPPLVTEAVLSPDGRLLAHLEGPDVSAESPDTPVGEWVLVTSDATTGTRRLRLRLAQSDREAVRLDYDGRWAVVSFARRGRLPREPGDPLPVVVVDTSAPRPQPAELEDVVGVASIVPRGPRTPAASP